MATNEAAIDVTGVAGSSHDFSTPPSPGGRASSRGVTGEKSARIVESTPATPTKKRQFSMTAAAKPSKVDPKDTADLAKDSKADADMIPPGKKRFTMDRVVRNPANKNPSKRPVGTGSLKPWKIGKRNSLDFFKDCDRVMVIDVETHELIQNREMLKFWATSKSGLATRVTEACRESQRIVQLGWAIGDLHGHNPQTTEMLVKPEGFEVDPEVTKKAWYSSRRSIRKRFAPMRSAS